MNIIGMSQLYGSSNSSPSGASPAAENKYTTGGSVVATSASVTGLRLGLHHHGAGVGLLSSGETEPSSESSSTGTSNGSLTGGDSPYNGGHHLHQQGGQQQRNLSRSSSRKPVEQQQQMMQQMNGIVSGVKQQQCIDDPNKTDKYDGRHSSNASSGSSVSGGGGGYNSNDTRQTVLMWGSSTSVGNASTGSCHSNDGSVSMTTADLITSTTATAYAAGTI